MKQNWANPESMDAGTDKFDKVIEWLLIALLAFMPFAFGAVEAWSEEVVIVLAAAISVIFAAKLVFRPNARFIWSWAYLPLALFVLVAYFQLLPLPAGLVEVISPNTAAIKKELLSDLPNADGRFWPWEYPSLTLYFRY